MPLKFFTVSAVDGGEDETEVNAFLRSHRVLTIRKEFVDHPRESPYWAIAVEYLEGAPLRKGKTPSIDYRDILNEADFGVFRRLRELRKQLAEADGRPVYTIFTNAQLAEMAKRRTGTKAQLLEIEGVGEAKIDKYGEKFLKAVTEEPDETNG